MKKKKNKKARNPYAEIALGKKGGAHTSRKGGKGYDRKKIKQLDRSQHYRSFICKITVIKL